jgi:hypothetical protein
MVSVSYQMLQFKKGDEQKRYQLFANNMHKLIALPHKKHIGDGHSVQMQASVPVPDAGNSLTSLS